MRERRTGSRRRHGSEHGEPDAPQEARHQAQLAD